MPAPGSPFPGCGEEPPCSTGAPEDVPLGRVQGVLLGSLVADPNVAELPFHVLAVEHVSEEHLIAGQGFPAKKEQGGFRRTPGACCWHETSNARLTGWSVT